MLEFDNLTAIPNDFLTFEDLITRAKAMLFCNDLTYLQESDQDILRKDHKDGQGIIRFYQEAKIFTPKRAIQITNFYLPNMTSLRNYIQKELGVENVHMGYAEYDEAEKKQIFVPILAADEDSELKHHGRILAFHEALPLIPWNFTKEIQFLELKEFANKQITAQDIQAKLKKSDAQIEIQQSSKDGAGSKSHSVVSSLPVQDPSNYIGYAYYNFISFSDFVANIGMYFSTMTKVADPATGILAVIRLVTFGNDELKNLGYLLLALLISAYFFRMINICNKKREGKYTNYRGNATFLKFLQVLRVPLFMAGFDIAYDKYKEFACAFRTRYGETPSSYSVLQLYVQTFPSLVITLYSQTILGEIDAILLITSIVSCYSFSKEISMLRVHNNLVKFGIEKISKEPEDSKVMLKVFEAEYFRKGIYTDESPLKDKEAVLSCIDLVGFTMLLVAFLFIAKVGLTIVYLLVQGIAFLFPFYLKFFYKAFSGQIAYQSEKRKKLASSKGCKRILLALSFGFGLSLGGGIFFSCFMPYVKPSLYLFLTPSKHTNNVNHKAIGNIAYTYIYSIIKQGFLLLIILLNWDTITYFSMVTTMFYVGVGCAGFSTFVKLYDIYAMLYFKKRDKKAVGGKTVVTKTELKVGSLFQK